MLDNNATNIAIAEPRRIPKCAPKISNNIVTGCKFGIDENIILKD